MFKTNAHTLAQALASVTRVIERRNSIPILGAARLRTESGHGLRVTGTNLDLQLDVMSSVEAVGASGEIAVNPRPILAMLRHLSGGDVVSVDLDGEGVVLGWNGARCRIPGFPGSDMPEIEVGNESVGGELDAAANDALGRVLPFISTEETRYYLNGVCIDGGAFVATDGHRLAVMHGGDSLAALCAQMGEARPIVPRQVSGLWRDMALGGDVAVAFWGAGFSKLSVERADVRLRAKVIDGNFPAWRRVVPDRVDLIPVELPRFALHRASMLVGAMCAAGKHGSATIVFRDGRAQLHAHSFASGEIAVDICAAPGLAAEVGLNVRYLASGLAATRGKTVTIWIGTEVNGAIPIRGSETGRDDHVVLMPMRTVDKIKFSAPELVLAA